MIAWDYEGHPQWYDPTRDAWSTPVEMPLDFDECYPDSVVARDLVFAFFCGSQRASNGTPSEATAREVPHYPGYGNRRA